VTAKSLPPPVSQEDGSGAGKRTFSTREALTFVRKHGVVLVSAKGKGPNLVEAIAGEPIKGSWWGHPAGKRIFTVLNAVTDSEEVLVCRLIDGKVTLVHRRLWPALARLAEAFPPERISQVRDEHTASGRHASRSVAFADWVPPEVVQEAEALGEHEARALLAEWLPPGATGRIERK
jgi:hypothetical protein